MVAVVGWSGFAFAFIPIIPLRQPHVPCTSTAVENAMSPACQALATEAARQHQVFQQYPLILAIVAGYAAVAVLALRSRPMTTILVSRSKLAAALVLLGVGIGGWLFLGGQVARCLGPVGGTGIQCVQATGVFPGVGTGIPFLAISLVVAAWLVSPPPADRRLAAFAWAAVGAVAGGAAYLALRPRTMEGFTGYGAWLTLVRPVDQDAMLAVAVTAALVVSVIGPGLYRRLPRARDPG